MCVFALLFSLIPVHSGYVIYLAVVTVVAEGSPAVHVTLSVILLMSLFLGVYQLLRHLRARRLKVVLSDKTGGVGEFEQGRGHKGGHQRHQDHHGEERGREHAEV